MTTTTLALIDLIGIYTREHPEERERKKERETSVAKRNQPFLLSGWNPEFDTIYPERETARNKNRQTERGATMSIRSGRSTGSGQTDETSKHQALDSALYRRRRRPGQAEIVGGGDGNGVESPELIRANDKEVNSRPCGRSNRRRSSVVAMIQLSSVLLVLGVALVARYQRTIHHMQHEQELLVQQQQPQPQSAIRGGVATTMHTKNATTKFSSSMSSSSMSSPACRQKDVPITNHTIRLYERPCQPIPVAFAISLIKVCTFVRTDVAITFVVVKEGLCVLVSWGACECSVDGSSVLFSLVVVLSFFLTLFCFAFAVPLIPSYTFSLSLFLYYTILVRQLPIDARGVGRCRSGLASFRSSVLQDAPVLRL